VSALAGVVSALTGPRLGGIFLAFPAILLARLTLVASEEGVRQAYNARSAALGTVGLLGFAIVAAATVTRWPVWLALTAACASWAIVALGGHLITRLGLGDDELPAADPSAGQPPGR
jgi:hypothetical protein